MAKGSKEAQAKRDEREREILFPFIDVTLLDGTEVTVEQWPITLGARLSAKIFSIQQRLAKEFGKATNLDTIIEYALDDVIDIVRQSVGWDVEEWTARVHGIEDFLGLFEAVWHTSILRPGGGGVFPLIMKIAGVSAEKLDRVAAQVADAVEEGEGEGPVSPKPSTDSSEPDTRSPTSGG